MSQMGRMICGFTTNLAHCRQMREVCLIVCGHNWFPEVDSIYLCLFILLPLVTDFSNKSMIPWKKIYHWQGKTQLQTWHENDFSITADEHDKTKFGKLFLLASILALFSYTNICLSRSLHLTQLKKITILAECSKFLTHNTSLHETRDKQPLGRELDSSLCHCHTMSMIKLFWSQPMAPWALYGQGEKFSA